MPEHQAFHYVRSVATGDRPPLLLLHGSSRDETELLPLAGNAALGWPYLSLRGGIDWDGGYAFFRRKPDRTLDSVDLALQTGRLHDFIATALETGLITHPPILVGFSNGAIIAASLLIRDPACAAGAILIRPLSPDLDTLVPDMPAKPILVLAGEYDDRRAPEDAIRVVAQFQAAGAHVISHTAPTGHDLHDRESAIIGDWLAQTFFPLVVEKQPR
ncbi:esterase [Rhizobium sp. S96]|uniref:alpha/beta hydrolase n=1 Tax=Rhizobium sp. S96 TaxID=3055140 RepID=UPI0025AA456B|nr:esterase [Rhizobium sp. S96]MDM9623505.1 esterase [Rhizobium sp. S96]